MRAQVALRRNVQPDRRGDIVCERLRQPARADLFVHGVDAVIRRVCRHRVDEVSDVVQQCCCDDVGGCIAADCGIRGLQHVLGDRDLLAEVGLSAPVCEQRGDLVDDGAHASPSCDASTAMVDRSPSMSA